jgi:hypothetical protein
MMHVNSRQSSPLPPPLHYKSIPQDKNSAIFAGRATSHNQNMTAGVATSSDTNTTVNLDIMEG